MPDEEISSSARARGALRSISQENLTSPRNSAHSELEKVVEIPAPRPCSSRSATSAVDPDGEATVSSHGSAPFRRYPKLAVRGIPRQGQVLLTDRPECNARARALLDGKSPWEHSRAGVGHPTALDFLSGACEPRVEQKEN
jgi:hypothetical protein